MKKTIKKTIAGLAMMLLMQQGATELKKANANPVFISYINQQGKVAYTNIDTKKTSDVNIDGYVVNVISFHKDSSSIVLKDDAANANSVNALNNSNKITESLIFNTDQSNVWITQKEQGRSFSINNLNLNANAIKDYITENNLDGIDYHRIIKAISFGTHSDDSIFFLAEPLASDGEIILNNDKCKIKIKSSETLEKICSYNNIKANKIGNITPADSEEQCDKSLHKDILNKIETVAKGAYNVNNIFGDKDITNVFFYNYDVKNACYYNNNLHFYKGVLNDLEISDLKSTAEHESLHHYIKKYDFENSMILTKLYADLLGTDESEKKEIMNHGMLIFGHVRVAKKTNNHAFFKFINENNFGGYGGHSKDSVSEFYTSFLHSLMFDNFEEVLTSDKWDTPRKNILENYDKVLEKMIRFQAARSRGSKFWKRKEPIEKFLIEKQDYIQELKKRYSN